LGTRISDANEVSVASIARSILEALAAKPDWDLDATQSPRESNTLNLDPTKARKMLAWRYGEDMRAASLKVIDAYMAVQDSAPECASTNKQDDE
jgi:hypothetical protein